MWMYNLVIRCYALLIHLSSLRNPKAAQWVQGRKNWRQQLKQQLNRLNGTNRVWMHCASYGEFEQGRPLLEALKSKHPEYQIVLSFFSPSGYQAFKHWPGADVVCYLPFDSAANARDFLQLVQPSKIIFIKYEFWLNFLLAIKQHKTESYLVAAIFKKHHPFFRWYGKIFKDSLSVFKTIFVQDPSSLQLLQSVGIHNGVLGGDTRFDRVVQIKNTFEPIPFFETYCRNQRVIVAGSTWPRDEEFLLEAFKALRPLGILLILVPHEVDTKSIEGTEARLKSAGWDYQLYSKTTNPVQGQPGKVLVVDAMGLLSRLYHYAHLTYIGGGFDSGIHNLLEPSVHLKPVLFAGKADFSKFKEAAELMAIDAAHAIYNPSDFVDLANRFLQNNQASKRIEEHLRTYLETQSGSTDRIVGLVFGKPV